MRMMPPTRFAWIGVGLAGLRAFERFCFVFVLCARARPLGDVRQERVHVADADIRDLLVTPDRKHVFRQHVPLVAAVVFRELRDVLLGVAHDQILDGRRDPAVVTGRERIATAVNLALQAFRLVTRDGHRPCRIVADIVAPAPRLEGVIEGEGLAAVLAHLQPKADHLVVYEDRRRPVARRRTLHEPFRQSRAHFPLAIAVKPPLTEPAGRTVSKMLFRAVRRDGENGRKGAETTSRMRRVHAAVRGGRF